LGGVILVNVIRLADSKSLNQIVSDVQSDRELPDFCAARLCGISLNRGCVSSPNYKKIGTDPLCFREPLPSRRQCKYSALFKLQSDRTKERQEALCNVGSPPAEAYERTTLGFQSFSSFQRYCLTGLAFGMSIAPEFCSVPDGPPGYRHARIGREAAECGETTSNN
jgi:hypothetical protein